MHEEFSYKSLQDIKIKAEELQVHIPISDDTSVLCKPLKFRHKTLPNRLVIQPMEGNDSDKNGNPTDMTIARYKNFAESGAAVIWFEATAVVPDGRCVSGQALINENNVSDIAELVDRIKEWSYKKNGFYPLIIMQATHSGRYTKEKGIPSPLIAYNNPIFEKENKIDESRIITDDELKRLEESYSVAFKLCKTAGFDGVDVKCCHRYLVSEFLSAYTRPGNYGGSFENRTRLYLNLVERANDLVDDSFFVTSRLNVYDGFPYPYGFGVNRDDGLTPDLTEGKKLAGILYSKYNIEMLNITIGNPYVNPHVNRPYDKGGYVPAEHPFEGLARMAYCCGEIQKAVSEMNIITSGNSYLRSFSANMAAGLLEQGFGTLAGFGRMAFAYPDFASDIVRGKGMDTKRCCITCGKCAELLRGGRPSGCVIRDRVYTEIYNR